MEMDPSLSLHAWRPTDQFDRLAIDRLFLRPRLRHYRHAETSFGTNANSSKNGMETSTEIIPYKTLNDGTDRYYWHISGPSSTNSLLKRIRTFQQRIPRSWKMVVIDTMDQKQTRSAKWASLTIIGMIIVLTGIAILSGGLSQFGNVPITIAYCLVVSTPLLLVIALAWRKTKSFSNNPQ